MLQFYVTLFLSAKGAQQDIKPFHKFSLNIFKMAKAHKQLMKEIALVVCGGIQGSRQLTQN